MSRTRPLSPNEDDETTEALGSLNDLLSLPKLTERAMVVAASEILKEHQFTPPPLPKGRVVRTPGTIVSPDQDYRRKKLIEQEWSTIQTQEEWARTADWLLIEVTERLARNDDPAYRLARQNQLLEQQQEIALAAERRLASIYAKLKFLLLHDLSTNVNNSDPRDSQQRAIKRLQKHWSEIALLPPFEQEKHIEILQEVNIFRHICWLGGQKFFPKMLLPVVEPPADWADLTADDGMPADPDHEEDSLRQEDALEKRRRGRPSKSGIVVDVPRSDPRFSGKYLKEWRRLRKEAEQNA